MRKFWEKIKNSDARGSWLALALWTIVFTTWASVFSWPIFIWDTGYAYFWCLLPTLIALVASPRARSQWGRWIILTVLIAASNSGFFPYLYAIGYTWLVWSRNRYARISPQEGDV